AFTLIAYGGAGPLHASAIGREIGMRHLIIPRAPGHFCAFGMLHSDLRYDNVRTTFRKLEEMDFAEVEQAFGELVDIGRRSLAESHVKATQVKVEYAADMRYVGQE